MERALIYLATIREAIVSSKPFSGPLNSSQLDAATSEYDRFLRRSGIL
jgi:hypothetical protein